LALGNVLGSNIFNICMIIGVVSLIAPLTIKKDAASKDFPMCLIAAVIVGVCGNQMYFDGIRYHELMLSDAIVFLCFFSIFIYYTLQEAISAESMARVITGAPASEQAVIKKEISPIKTVVFIVLGLAGLAYGGDLIVDGATGVAEAFGLSERVIGLLIVGPGTSLPELITSIVAALKKNSDIVIGNILGSNTFNIFFTLAVTAIIQPVSLDLGLNIAVIINVIITLLLVLYAWFSRQKQVGRTIGMLLIAAYMAYTFYTVIF
ncbi:unnamed protein product, partial [marine sediment metagenome]